MGLFNEKAAPFHFDGTADHGVLLIHGYGGTPAKLRLLGEYLHQEGGLTVSALLLRGHGTSPEDMRDASWSDWLEDTFNAYDRLREKCGNIYVVGLSMGALLALLTAANREVRKLVTIGAAMGFKNKLVYGAPLLQHIVKKHRLPDLRTQFPTEAAHYLMENNIGYDECYFKSMADALRLRSLARKIIPTITCPTLIIQSKVDETVTLYSARRLYDHLGAREKRILWIEKSRHHYVLGPERDLIHKNVLNFITNKADLSDRLNVLR